MDKKAALLYIYKILSEQTDASHRLKQDEIAKILKEKYGIELERKAIGRNLQIINDAGFEIGGDESRKGSYLNKEFETNELLFLIECVRSNPSLTKDPANKLIKKNSRTFFRIRFRRRMPDRREQWPRIHSVFKLPVFD